MAMAPERSKALHNFSLPCLKWGNQRFLRCMKIPPNSDPRSSPEPNESHQKLNISINSTLNPSRNPKPTFNTHKEIQAVRQKPMVDPGVATKKLKVSVLEAGKDQNSRPWNLRTRRAACTAPKDERKRELGSSSQIKEEATKVKANRVIEKEWVKFAVPLSKEEVEEDFVKMVGTRPPRRPKKRPRIVQKQLNSIFPGLWLMEVTVDSYKVPDVPE